MPTWPAQKMGTKVTSSPFLKSRVCKFCAHTPRWDGSLFEITRMWLIRCHQLTFERKRVKIVIEFRCKKNILFKIIWEDLSSSHNYIVLLLNLTLISPSNSITIIIIIHGFYLYRVSSMCTINQMRPRLTGGFKNFSEVTLAPISSADHEYHITWFWLNGNQSDVNIVLSEFI